MSETIGGTSSKIVVAILIGLLAGSVILNVQLMSEDKVSQEDYDELDSSYKALQEDFESMQNNYTEILSVYQNVLDDYNELIVNFEILQGDHSELNDTYYSLIEEYNDLLNSYHQLQEDYIQLSDSYVQLQEEYNNLQNEHNNLETQYNLLLSLYNQLQVDYSQLQTDYSLLQESYSILQAEYVVLETVYNMYIDTIRSMPLIVRLPIFYEAVRQAITDRHYSWQAYTDFMRDMILHDTYQYNAFSELTEKFVDIFEYSDPYYGSMDDTFWALYYFVLPFAWYSDIEDIVNWCIDNIDYEYDDAFTYGVDYFGDYPKFSLETVLRTFGDCEDQAILCATILESCGFDTIIAGIHDPNWNNGAGLYHAFLWVYDPNYTTNPDIVWRMNSTNYDWVLLDPTWDVEAGSTPSWFNWYYDDPSRWTEDIVDYTFVDPY